MADWSIGRVILIGKKEVKFVTIVNLIGAAESEILKWKSSPSQLNRVTETISAFSNTKGGTIIIRVGCSP